MPPTSAPSARQARMPSETLAHLKLGELRSTFSEHSYRRSSAIALAWLALDAAVYGVLVYGALRADHLLAQLLCGLLAGGAVAALFVWAHDAAHGALFKSQRLTDVLGTLAMLPSLSMYRLWVYGHNRVHHGFTSFSPVDWIWRPLTPDQYRAKSRIGRLSYRFERCLIGCPWHYIARVWWPGMVRFRAEREVRRRYHFTASKVLTAAATAVAVAAAWAIGGVGAIFHAVVAPWLVFNFFIALFVYLHHTHPELPFYNDRKQWSATIGQLACSTVVRTSKLMALATHNILIHTPHHVDTRIPFYRLPRAWKELSARYGSEVLEYRFRWRTVRSIFRTCQLFDFDTKCWYRFRDFRGGRQPVAVEAPAAAVIGSA